MNLKKHRRRLITPLNNLPLFISSILVLNSCSTDILPKSKIFPYKFGTEIKVDKDLCSIKLTNPLNCDLRVWVKHQDENVTSYFSELNPITLPAKADTVLTVTINKQLDTSKLIFPSRYGNPSTKINTKKVSLPFKPNSTYRIIQGNKSSFSHSSSYSNYAIDFSLNNGDTICAVADGYVVGMIEGHSKSGRTAKWRQYANLITLYHPQLNLFSQYVHLEKNGSLVALGDTIKETQTIGICGMTGFTRGEHLHFALLKAVGSNDGLNSIPIEFKEGYEGTKLKKGDTVSN